jgi:hypothetical protein
MSQFKNNPDINLYYTDIDSVYIDRSLSDYMISSKILGKCKLENIINKVIFLAPKMYYLETVDGKIIYKVKDLKPLVVTKDSNSSIISKYLQSRIRLACDVYFLEKSMIQEFSNPDGPSILIKYKKIRLFLLYKSKT